MPVDWRVRESRDGHRPGRGQADRRCDGQAAVPGSPARAAAVARCPRRRQRHGQHEPEGCGADAQFAERERDGKRRPSRQRPPPPGENETVQRQQDQRQQRPGENRRRQIGDEAAAAGQYDRRIARRFRVFRPQPAGQRRDLPQARQTEQRATRRAAVSLTPSSHQLTWMHQSSSGGRPAPTLRQVADVGSSDPRPPRGRVDRQVDIAHGRTRDQRGDGDREPDRDRPEPGDQQRLAERRLSAAGRGDWRRARFGGHDG